MKAAKFAYLVALLVLLGITRISLMIGFMFPGHRHSGDQIRLSSVLFLLTVGFLLASWFFDNPRAKRQMENASLLVGVFFFRSFALSDVFEWVPLWCRLLFVVSFGVFLYFKMMKYFNRKRESDPVEGNK